jgi:uncharacterized membrane protein
VDISPSLTHPLRFQLFVFCFVVTAMVMASNNDGRNGSKSDGFAAIWTMLLIIGLSIGGTLVMRKYQTPLAVGFFLGVCIMMCVNMFSLFVLFLGAAYLEDKLAKESKDEKTMDQAKSTASSDKAIAAFCFFLFLCYGIFSILLAKFRNFIVKDGSALGSHVDQPAAAPEMDSGSGPPPVSV